MTREDEKATISALLEERRGYELRGESKRLAEVDAQLAALGAGAKKPSQRATRRPSERKKSKR